MLGHNQECNMSGNKGNDQVAIIDHLMINNTSVREEERNKRLEASGNCLVNRSFDLGWLQTPIPTSMYPPVDNKVNVSQRENDILDSEQSEVNERRKQVNSLLTDSL